MSAPSSGGSKTTPGFPWVGIEAKGEELRRERAEVDFSSMTGSGSSSSASERLSVSCAARRFEILFRLSRETHIDGFVDGRLE